MREEADQNPKREFLPMPLPQLVTCPGQIRGSLR